MFRISCFQKKNILNHLTIQTLKDLENSHIKTKKFETTSGMYIKIIIIAWFLAELKQLKTCKLNYKVVNKLCKSQPSERDDRSNLPVSFPLRPHGDTEALKYLRSCDYHTTLHVQHETLENKILQLFFRTQA